MASYLERYRQGECEQVWSELVALGEQVRSEPLYTDALAVARETMRRARHNIEILIPRLETIGYKFGYDWLRDYDRDFAEEEPAVFTPPEPDVRERIEELQSLIGVLPLSLHAFYEVVGSVNFVRNTPMAWQVSDLAGQDVWYRFISSGPTDEQYDAFIQQHPQFTMESRHLKYGLDPLTVYPLKLQFEIYEHLKEVWEKRGAHQAPHFEILISGDSWHKYNISGSGAYEIKTANASADAPLLLEWHHTGFVNYLRICFRWGGLPGLERAAKPPMKDLAYLTEGLLPI